MAGFGLPLSVLIRCIEKIALDTTGLVVLRHPVYAGGFYYCVNAVMTHVACFVAATLYSAYATSVASNHWWRNAHFRTHISHPHFAPTPEAPDPDP